MPFLNAITGGYFFTLRALINEINEQRKIIMNITGMIHQMKLKMLENREKVRRAKAKKA